MTQYMPGACRYEWKKESNVLVAYDMEGESQSK